MERAVRECVLAMALTVSPPRSPLGALRQHDMRSRAMSSPMAPNPNILSTSLLGTSPVVMTASRHVPDVAPHAHAHASGSSSSGAAGASSGTHQNLHPSSAMAIPIKGASGHGHGAAEAAVPTGITPASFESRLSIPPWERTASNAAGSSSQASLRTLSSESGGPAMATAAASRPSRITAALSTPLPSRQGSQPTLPTQASQQGQQQQQQQQQPANTGYRPPQFRKRLPTAEASPPSMSPPASPAIDAAYAGSVGASGANSRNPGWASAARSVKAVARPTYDAGAPPVPVAQSYSGVPPPAIAQSYGAGAGFPVGSAYSTSSQLPPNPPPSFNPGYGMFGELGASNNMAHVVGSAPQHAAVRPVGPGPATLAGLAMYQHVPAAGPLGAVPPHLTMHGLPVDPYALGSAMDVHTPPIPPAAVDAGESAVWDPWYEEETGGDDDTMVTEGEQRRGHQPAVAPGVAGSRPGQWPSHM